MEYNNSEEGLKELLPVVRTMLYSMIYCANLVIDCSLWQFPCGEEPQGKAIKTVTDMNQTAHASVSKMFMHIDVSRTYILVSQIREGIIGERKDFDRL